MTEIVHGVGTCGWSPETGQMFFCPWCERGCCYCEGATDDTPALCDDCAAKLFAIEEREGRTE